MEHDSIEQVKSQVKKEIALANAQELINKINNNCFKMCIQTPESSLTSKNQDCLNKCADKYLAAWDLVSQAYVSRVQNESSNFH